MSDRVPRRTFKVEVHRRLALASSGRSNDAVYHHLRAVEDEHAKGLMMGAGGRSGRAQQTELHQAHAILNSSPNTAWIERIARR